jgi:hypothetical protein
MIPLLYKLGSLKALQELGMKVAVYGSTGGDGLGMGTGFGSDPSGDGRGYNGNSQSGSDERDFKGTPYPSKSPLINAERLADLLRSQEEDTGHISPENRRNDAWDRPVTWSASQNMSGLDSGHQAAGIMMPGNPRS